VTLYWTGWSGAINLNFCNDNLGINNIVGKFSGPTSVTVDVPLVADITDTGPDWYFSLTEDCWIYCKTDTSPKFSLDYGGGGGEGGECDGTPFPTPPPSPQPTPSPPTPNPYTSYTPSPTATPNPLKWLLLSFPIGIVAAVAAAFYYFRCRKQAAYAPLN
jgi:hypothetical protein